jgi:hypothetical protein
VLDERTGVRNTRKLRSNEEVGWMVSWDCMLTGHETTDYGVGVSWPKCRLSHVLPDNVAVGLHMTSAGDNVDVEYSDAK